MCPVQISDSDHLGRPEKLWLVLRECALTQRWPEGATVMTGLVNEIRNTGQSIMKVRRGGGVPGYGPVHHEGEAGGSRIRASPS